MTERTPTQRGDVLILRTDHSFTLHAVGQVTRDGQEDFETHVNVKYATDRAAAVAKAKALVEPGQRIFFRHLDSGDWSVISD
jgi:hypothetical protein